MSVAGILGSDLTRTVSNGVETISAQVDDIMIDNTLYQKINSYAEVTGDISIANGLTAALDKLKDEIIAMTDKVAEIILDPAAYDEAYTSAILTALGNLISANMTAGGTGLPEDVEAGIWNRMRERAIAIGNRSIQRVRIELNKRLPYTGMVSDLYAESNRDYVSAMSEANRDIAYKQAELAWQQQRAIIDEALKKEALGQGDLHAKLERDLKAYSVYEELKARNDWKYYETLIKAVTDYTAAGVEYLAKVAYGQDQHRFENLLAIVKTIMDGQLRVSGQIAQLMPGGPLE